MNLKLGSLLAPGPFGIGSCLPGTELLQSLFRVKFSMGSLSWRYHRSLQRYQLIKLLPISVELSPIPAAQYGFFFLGSNVHFDIFAR